MKIFSEMGIYFSKDFGELLDGEEVLKLVITSSVGVQNAWGCELWGCRKDCVLPSDCDSAVTGVILAVAQLKPNIGNNTGLLHTVAFAALYCCYGLCLP